MTNTGDSPIRHDGDTKGWPYSLPTSTVLDLTGVHDPGIAWDGNAGRFKQRFLESQTIARLIMEQQPSGDGGEFPDYDDEFPDYGIRRRLRPGASFQLPVVTVPRYVWRDQPLPGGTASVDATFCFRRPSAKAGRREACLRSSAPVTIEGEPVEYPGPAEIVDAALSDPEFRGWVGSRKPNAGFDINVAGIFPDDHEVTFWDLGYMGGPAPAETIWIRTTARGASPTSASIEIELDPWDVTASDAADATPASDASPVPGLG
ncbi:MAG: hypothetical protein ACC726_11260 [Chloroflexota bacterium]